MTPVGVSVITPAYNKRKVLPETLAALRDQDAPGGYEVIVVDDGSTDGTLEWLHEQAQMGMGSSGLYQLVVLSQANGGPAAARNAGVTAASGKLLLFLDADIVASPGLLAAHIAAHERYPHALVMGRVHNWPGAAGGPAYQVYGQSFDFGDEERMLPPRFGITQNISITAADFAACGAFDTRLPWGEDTEFVYRASMSTGFDPKYPRGQDIEFAYRLDANSMALHYCPAALAFHNHPLSLQALCAKARKDHRLLVLLFQRYPNILNDLDYLQDKLPIALGRDPARLVLRKTWRSALATAPVRAALEGACGVLERRWPSPAALDFLVWKLLGAYQWLGLREGMREYNWRPGVRS